MCKNKSGKQQSPSNSHGIECPDNLTVKSYKQNCQKRRIFLSLVPVEGCFLLYDLFPGSQSEPV